jgi:hypothetical protein
MIDIASLNKPEKLLCLKTEFDFTIIPIAVDSPDKQERKLIESFLNCL